MEVDVFEIEVRVSDLPPDVHEGQRVACELHEVVACSFGARWVLPNWTCYAGGAETARPRYSLAKANEIAGEVRRRGTINSQHWDQEV